MPTSGPLYDAFYCNPCLLLAYSTFKVALLARTRPSYRRHVSECPEKTGSPSPFSEHFQYYTIALKALHKTSDSPSGKGGRRRDRLLLVPVHRV